MIARDFTEQHLHHPVYAAQIAHDHTAMSCSYGNLTDFFSSGGKAHGGSGCANRSGILGKGLKEAQERAPLPPGGRRPEFRLWTDSLEAPRPGGRNDL